MNSKTIISFVVGALSGAAAAWYYAKNHFQTIADEEIAEVKAEYKRTHNAHVTMAQEEIAKSLYIREYSVEKIADILNIEETDAVYKMLGVEKPTDEEPVERIERPQYHKVDKPEAKPDGPRVIPPEEFGNETLAVTWTFYSDGTITDEMDNIVEDVDDAFGKGFVPEFDENGVVYITNPTRHCDYELVYEDEPYSSLHRTEV